MWRDGNNIMRTIRGRNGNQTLIYINPTGPDDQCNDMLMISGAALQGGAGRNPNYTTLAADVIALHYI